MSGIGLIHNPNASRNKGKRWLADRLRWILGEDGIVEETPVPEKIAEVAERFKKNGVDLLLINGGDGTSHLVLSYFLKVYGEIKIPPFLHLRGGTMNTIANSLGVVRLSTEKLIKRILEKYRRKEKFDIIERNIIKIGDRFGFIFGSGLVSNFLEAYYSGKGRGALKAIKVILRGILSAIGRTGYSKDLFRNVIAKIIADGETIPMKAFTVILGATVRDVGLGFKPAYLAETPERFHFIASDIKVFQLLMNIPRLLMAKPLSREYVYDRLVRSVTLEPAQGFTFKYTIDGELYTAREPISLELGPALSVIRG